MGGLPGRGCLFSFLVMVLLGGCERHSPANRDALVIYSGRSKDLVEPLLIQFRQQTGLTVQVRYGDTAELLAALQEEGGRSPADLFWAQDAGALGAAEKAGLLAPLPAEILNRVAMAYRSPSGHWLATSGRARTLAYAPQRVSAEELPQSVLDLTDPKWKGRVGWAPLNASFQSFVTAMRHALGEQRTRQWLSDMKANGAKSYPKNTPIIEDIRRGVIDLGLPNHYYLLGFKKKDPRFPVEQAFFAPGDIGNLVNVAGIGVLHSSSQRQSAQRFVEFLLSEEAQNYFARTILEFPVIESVQPGADLISQEELLKLAPSVDLNELDDLRQTLDLLREVGLL